MLLGHYQAAVFIDAFGFDLEGTWRLTDEMSNLMLFTIIYRAMVNYITWYGMV